MIKIGDLIETKYNHCHWCPIVYTDKNELWKYEAAFEFESDIPAGIMCILTDLVDISELDYVFGELTSDSPWRDSKVAVISLLGKSVYYPGSYLNLSFQTISQCK